MAYTCGRWGLPINGGICGKPAEKFVLTRDIFTTTGSPPRMRLRTRVIPICSNCARIDDYANALKDIEISENEYWVHQIMEL